MDRCEWRDIIGLGGVYQVSRDGLVRSIDRIVIQKNGVPRRVVARIIKPKRNAGGMLVFYPEPIRRLVCIADEVLRCFVGEEPASNSFAGHRDGDMTNLSTENLFWITDDYNIKTLSIPGEEWRGVTICPSSYMISSHGRVYAKNGLREPGVRVRGRVMRQTQDALGYRSVDLTRAGLTSPQRVHRLVAMAFLPEIDGKYHVNHKDGNPSNNHVSNLEWCTHQENMLHAWEMKRARGGARKTGRDFEAVANYFGPDHPFSKIQEVRK